MNAWSSDLAKVLKNYLEWIQPNPVKYGYPRGVKREKSFVTYQSAGTQFTRGIGNDLISERQTYIVTVQTKTALQNMMYSDLIKYGTEGRTIEFVSDDFRKDTTVDAGYINTIILRVYSPIDVVIYTAEQVRAMLQEIADLYIFVTSRYDKTIAESFIDTYTVPELEDRAYSEIEVIQMKQEYYDKLLLKSTEY